MRFSLKQLFLLTTVVAITCVAFLIVQHAMATRAIVSEDLPNGTRVRVVQEFSGEPFNTSIYFDDGDGQWRWYYYDHEDWYWGTADSTFEAGVLHVSTGSRSIVIDTVTGECEISGSQMGNRRYEKVDYN